jgi:hypothetical protein
MDSWFCGGCNRQFPTHAFTCRREGCGDWAAGPGDYCSEHDPERQEPG